ncbi:MAG: ATP-binding protein [Planctomycetota bacterium]|jgi:predicted ATPase with chaperone activity
MQDTVKNALEAAGRENHALVLIGAPARALQVARTFVDWLPEWTLRQQHMGHCIHVRYGLTDRDNPLKKRPMRAPHYTIGDKALYQEMELAFGGVLILDEAHEFPKRQLEIVGRKHQEKEKEFWVVLTTTPEGLKRVQKQAWVKILVAVPE